MSDQEFDLRYSIEFRHPTSVQFSGVVVPSHADKKNALSAMVSQCITIKSHSTSQLVPLKTDDLHGIRANTNSRHPLFRITRRKSSQGDKGRLHLVR